ncbi:MAG TPA: hypothetical protein VER08_04035 [Pyrinomonadaceae bacterium]|nr:hypothetical protein [Pyrinomonadaceae bacterium]
MSSCARGRVLRVVLALAACVACAGEAWAQRSRAQRARPAAAQGAEEAEFGPVVRAYLGYLRAQQEVVDDRVSRREIDQKYYHHNSNRIRALRQMAVRLARETGNDFLPELEAVTQDEFRLLFEEPPDPATFRVGETLYNFTFRFLGVVPTGRERFYLFARLDPYEQAELRKGAAAQPTSKTETRPGAGNANAPAPVEPASSRPRRVNEP